MVSLHKNKEKSWFMEKLFMNPAFSYNFLWKYILVFYG